MRFGFCGGVGVVLKGEDFLEHLFFSGFIFQVKFEGEFSVAVSFAAFEDFARGGGALLDVGEVGYFAFEEKVFYEVEVALGGVFAADFGAYFCDFFRLGVLGVLSLPERFTPAPSSEAE